jgi:hypothetical protein
MFEVREQPILRQQGTVRCVGWELPCLTEKGKGLTMTYTYRTEQFGVSGAVGSIFKDGIVVWSTDMIQAFGRYDTDRKRAARIVRKRIAELKQLD